MSSREKIVNAAVELFYRRGYQATSIDDIIAGAAVCKSNFYYHFKSKEELGVEVLDQRKDQFKQVMATTLNNEEMMPRQRLESFLELILQAQDTRLG